jgi:thiol-disulfide isomerase/thioredoxin
MNHLISILLIFSSATLVLAQETKPMKAPSLELKDLKGKTVKLSKYKGKVVLVNFWATWCAPCVAEVPELVRWQHEYADELQIVGITYPPTSLAQVRGFVRDHGINYPILLGSKATKRLFDPSDNLPITVIIDRVGNIVDRIDGLVFADEFEAKIKPLIKPR